MDSRLASDLACPLGFAVVTATCVVLSVAAPSLGTARVLTDVAVLTVVVAIFAWFVRPIAALVTAALGWLLLNGFLVDHFGALRWHGEVDAVRLVTLIAAAAIVTLVRSTRRYGWSLQPPADQYY